MNIMKNSPPLLKTREPNMHKKKIFLRLLYSVAVKRKRSQGLNKYVNYEGQVTWGSNLGMKTTFFRSRTSGNGGSTTPSFFWRVSRSSLLDFWLLCVIFVELLTSVGSLCWRHGLVLLHTRVWRLWNGNNLVYVKSIIYTISKVFNNNNL